MTPAELCGVVTSKLSGEPTLYSPNGFAGAARQALTKPGVEWEPTEAERAYNEGRPTQCRAYDAEARRELSALSLRGTGAYVPDSLIGGDRDDWGRTLGARVGYGKEQHDNGEGRFRFNVRAVNRTSGDCTVRQRRRHLGQRHRR